MRVSACLSADMWAGAVSEVTTTLSILLYAMLARLVESLRAWVARALSKQHELDALVLSARLRGIPRERIATPKDTSIQDL